MRRLKSLIIVGLLIVPLAGWSVTQSQQSQEKERVCTVGPVGEFKKISDAVEKKVEKDPSKYECDRIVVGPGTYENENIQINDRGKPLKIEPSAEDGERLVKGAIKDGQPQGQTIFIINAKHTVTIEGLHVTQGRTGILVQESPNTVIRNVAVYGNIGAGISIQKSPGTSLQNVSSYDNKGAGILIGDSTGVKIVKIIGARKPSIEPSIYNNEADGILVEAGSEVEEISDLTIRNNRNGIVVVDKASKATVNRSVIEQNRENGILVSEGSTANLSENHIFQNTKCGVNAAAGVTVNDLKQEPSNWIVANKGGNVCAPDPNIKNRIKMREIHVPRHIANLQDAIKEAEPVKGEEKPYDILVGPLPNGSNEYVENLCIDRSVTLQATVPLVLKAKNPAQPTIAIAFKDLSCPLHEEERANPTKITFQRDPQARLDARWLIDGGLVGVRIGNAHGDAKKKPVYVEVELRDTSIQNQQQVGVNAVASGEGNVIQLNMIGPSPLVDNQCKKTDPSEISKINGISVESQPKALVKAEVRNVEISNSRGAGLKIIYRGSRPTSLGPFNEGADLLLTHSILNGSDFGLVIESQDQAKPEIFISNILAEENKQGGLSFKAGLDAPMKIELGYMHIKANRGHGVHLQGPVTVTWEEPLITVDDKGQYENECWVINNEGSGIRIERGASATLSSLKIISNGYDLTKKPSGNYERSGIYVIGPANLELQNSHIVNNAWNGIGLQAWETQPNMRLKATIQDNRVENNEKWGVAQIIRGCIDSLTQSAFNGEVRGRNNLIEGNGNRLSEPEKRATPKQYDPTNPGKLPQVCPDSLLPLKEGTQQ